MSDPEILVWASYSWTCQECLETVEGFESDRAAAEDSDEHKCEVYT